MLRDLFPTAIYTTTNPRASSLPGMQKEYSKIVTFITIEKTDFVFAGTTALLSKNVASTTTNIVAYIFKIPLRGPSPIAKYITIHAKASWPKGMQCLKIVTSMTISKAEFGFARKPFQLSKNARFMTTRPKENFIPAFSPTMTPSLKSAIAKSSDT